MQKPPPPLPQTPSPRPPPHPFLQKFSFVVRDSAYFLGVPPSSWGPNLLSTPLSLLSTLPTLR